MSGSSGTLKIRWHRHYNKAVLYFVKHRETRIVAAIFKGAPTEVTQHRRNVIMVGIIIWDPLCGPPLHHFYLLYVLLDVRAPQSESESELLLVTRSNDNHSPGDPIKLLLQNRHKWINIPNRGFYTTLYGKNVNKIIYIWFREIIFVDLLYLVYLLIYHNRSIRHCFRNIRNQNIRLGNLGSAVAWIPHPQGASS